MSTPTTPRTGSPTGSQCYETYTYEEAVEDVDAGQQESPGMLLLPEAIQELAAMGNSSPTLLNLLQTIRTIMGHMRTKSDSRPDVQAAYSTLLQELLNKTKQLPSPTQPAETQEVMGLLQDLIPLFSSTPSMQLKLTELQQANRETQNLNMLTAQISSNETAAQTLQKQSQETIAALRRQVREIRHQVDMLALKATLPTDPKELEQYQTEMHTKRAALLQQADALTKQADALTETSANSIATLTQNATALKQQVAELTIKERDKQEALKPAAVTATREAEITQLHAQGLSSTNLNDLFKITAQILGKGLQFLQGATEEQVISYHDVLDDLEAKAQCLYLDFITERSTFDGTDQDRICFAHAMLERLSFIDNPAIVSCKQTSEALSLFQILRTNLRTELAGAHGGLLRKQREVLPEVLSPQELYAQSLQALSLQPPLLSLATSSDPDANRLYAAAHAAAQKEYEDLLTPLAAQFRTFIDSLRTQKESFKGLPEQRIPLLRALSAQIDIPPDPKWQYFPIVQQLQQLKIELDTEVERLTQENAQIQKEKTERITAKLSEWRQALTSIHTAISNEPGAVPLLVNTLQQSLVPNVIQADTRELSRFILVTKQLRDARDQIKKGLTSPLSAEKVLQALHAAFPETPKQ